MAPRTMFAAPLERFRAKWAPVRVKKTRQNKNLEPPFRFNRNGKGSRVSTSDSWRSFQPVHAPDMTALMMERADRFRKGEERIDLALGGTAGGGGVALRQ